MERTEESLNRTKHGLRDSLEFKLFGLGLNAFAIGVFTYAAAESLMRGENGYAAAAVLFGIVSAGEATSLCEDISRNYKRK